MTRERKLKGDIGASKIIADLTEKEYVVFVPAVCESAPFDLIAYKNGKSFRIQCKYSSINKVDNKRTYCDSKGTHSNKYSNDEFDYYGIYLSQIGQVVYPSVKFGRNKYCY